jgi:beta-lactamase regulating signal transducer with metallopeptidase domain
MNPTHIDLLLQTLGHSLWQGAVLALSLVVALRLLPARAAQARYLLALAALGLTALAPVLTWSMLSRPRAVEPIVVRAGTPLTAAPVIERVYQPATGHYAEVRRGLRVPWRGILAATWAAGAAVFLLRLVGAVSGARKLRRGAYRPTPNPELTGKLVSLAGRLGVPAPVQLMLHADLAVPAVCGLFRPVILVPASLVTGLSPAHLEAVLAHELAHIRRHDYLVNLAQMTLEALLFFNPFVWWISRQVRLERETACDALALSVLENGAPTDYVRVLTGIAESSLPVPLALPAMSGPRGDRGQLLERVRRLLRPGERPRLRLSWPGALGFLLASFGVLVLLRFTAGAAVDLLTRERMQKVAELQQRFPITDQVIPPQRVIMDKVYQVRLQGRAETSDGRPLTELVRVSASSAVNEYRFGEGWQFKGGEPFDTSIMKAGRIYLAASTKGYAPVFMDLGPVLEDRADLVLRFEPGYNSALRLRDESGRPVADAKVTIGFMTSETRPNAPYSDFYTTNGEGVIRLEGLVKVPMFVELKLPGYQREYWTNLQFPPGEMLDKTLKRAVPLQGRILGEAGQPLAGAQILMAHYFGPQVQGGGGSTPVATTDAEGRFSLDSLQDQTTYYLEVRAQGFARQVLGPVVSGGVFEPRLRPGGTLRVEVRGLDPSLTSADGRVRLSYSYMNRVSPDFGRVAHPSVQESYYATSEGGVARFDVPLMLDATLDFQLDRRRLRVSREIAPQEARTLVLDAADFKAPEDKGAPPREAPSRPVEITLVPPAGMPPAEGALILSHSTGEFTPTGGQAFYERRYQVKLKDGKALAQMPLPNRMTILPDAVRGYWFKFGQEQEQLARPDKPGEPLKITLNAVPAGAIHGKVLEADGQPARGQLYIRAFPVSPAPEGFFSQHVNLFPDNEGEPGAFFLNPLPLGNTYIVSAQRGNSIQLSQPLVLTDQRDVQDVELRFTGGQTVRGTVLGPDGAPLRGAGVQLGFDFDNQYTNFGTVLTDLAGRFEFEGVIPHANGTYRLNVSDPASRWYLSQTVEFGKSNDFAIRPRAVRGLVKNAETNAVMPGARVQVSGGAIHVNSRESAEFTVTADAAGRFTLPDLPGGRYWLKIADSQDSASVSFQVLAAPVTEVEFLVRKKERHGH